MTKKRLSDLLKEEANSPPDKDKPAAEATPAAAANSPKTSSSSKSSRRLTKADLEQQVQDLIATLEASQQREARPRLMTFGPTSKIIRPVSMTCKKR